MHPLPDVPELHALARRVGWFKSPCDAIAMPVHFIAHVLTFGTHKDVSVWIKFVPDDDRR